MPLIYKTLYEVKLMHEYYLTRQDGQTVFALADQAQRLSFLRAQFSLGFSSINADLSFEFPKHLQSFYEGHLLKILPSYSGFRIVVRVNQKTLADGTLVYQPWVSLPDNMDIKVVVKKKGNSIDRYTNTRTTRSIPSIYFFSSEGFSEPRTFPFLSDSIPAIKGNYQYEQGELASFGSNDTRFFYRDAGSDQWSPVVGNAFANENDQLLLPSKFNFFFGATDQVKDAVFSLRKKDGTIVKNISVSRSENINKVELDFSDKSHLVSMPETASHVDSVLQMEVSGNGYFKNFPLLIGDSFYSSDVWGVISIAVRSSSEPFRLFTNEGYLKKMKTSVGVWEEAPVFEIPVKSRHPFWRFINNRGKELKLTQELNDYLLKENKILVTKKPRAVSQSFFFLQKEGSSQKKYVPNPLSYDLKKDEKERWCFDIMVPQSELFPVV